MALALTGATEGPHFDKAAFKVARIYVVLAADGRTANVEFTNQRTTPIPNAWGRHGWTTATLSKLSAVELKNALELRGRTRRRSAGGDDHKRYGVVMRVSGVTEYRACGSFTAA